MTNDDLPEDCENCDGAGWFETEDDAFRCSTCDGTGIVQEQQS